MKNEWEIDVKFRDLITVNIQKNLYKPTCHDIHNNYDHQISLF